MGSRMDDRVWVSADLEHEPPRGDEDLLESLAAAARERRAGAFDALARRVGSRMMAYAVTILRDRGLAEEAVQEAFIRIYRNLPSYRERNFLAWSFTITNRVCSNLLRRERRHERLLVALRPSHTHDPTQAISSRVVIEAALAALPLHFLQPFLLHEQGLGYDEIGVVLGIPIGTVRSRLFRARMALKELLVAR